MYLCSRLANIADWIADILPSPHFDYVNRLVFEVQSILLFEFLRDFGATEPVLEMRFLEGEYRPRNYAAHGIEAGNEKHCGLWTR